MRPWARRGLHSRSRARKGIIIAPPATARHGRPMPQTLLALCMVAAAWAQQPIVPVIDGPLMDRLLSSGGVAFVKFDTSPCARCEGLDAAWEALAAEFPGLIARVDCVQTPDVCAARHVVFDGQDPQPAMKFWTGSSFRRYSGPHELDYLRFYVQSRLAPAESAGSTPGPVPSTAPSRPSRDADPRRAQRDNLRSAVLLLFSYASGLVLVLVLLRKAVAYLQAPAEDPGWLLIVSSMSGADTGGGLFVFRVEPCAGRATPIAFHSGVKVGHLCAQPAPRALWLRSWLPCYTLHAAAKVPPAKAPAAQAPTATEGKRAGEVVSLLLDARRAPCLRLLGSAAVGGGGAACVHVSAAGAEGAVACASDGSVSLLTPDLRPPPKRYLRLLLWPFVPRGVNLPTGGLRRHAVLHRPTSRGAGPPSNAGHVAAVPLHKPNAGVALVADESGKRLFLVRVGAASPGGSGAALHVSCGPTHLALHPDGVVAYALCPASGILLVLGLQQGMTPPKLAQSVQLVLPEGKNSQHEAKSSLPEDKDTGGGCASGAGLVCTRDGRFVYASVGGRVAALRVSGGGARLAMVQGGEGGEAETACIALAGGCKRGRGEGEHEWRGARVFCPTEDLLIGGAAPTNEILLTLPTYTPPRHARWTTPPLSPRTLASSIPSSLATPLSLVQTHPTPTMYAAPQPAKGASAHAFFRPHAHTTPSPPSHPPPPTPAYTRPHGSDLLALPPSPPFSPRRRRRASPQRVSRSQPAAHLQSRRQHRQAPARRRGAVPCARLPAAVAMASAQGLTSLARASSET
jgi:hypothetical protein